MGSRGFEYFHKDGKLSRRTFVKGVGTITVASVLGTGMAGCASEIPEQNAGTAQSDAAEQRIVHGFCSYNCNSACSLQGTIRDGKLVAIEPGQMPGRPDYANCCLRGISYIQRIQDETVRTMYPMKRTGERGSGDFERISWDEAIDTIAEKLNAVLDEDPKLATFYYFTGNMAKLAWESPMRMANCLGAAIWTVEGIMSDHGASVAMDMMYGAQRAGHDTRDYMNSELIIWWGGNSMDTHTSEAKYLLNAKENGAKFIVIDPRLSSTAAMADQWVPIRPQTDPVLALAMMKLIIENDLHDKTWLANYSCAPLLVDDATGEYLHPNEGTYVAWDTAANAAIEIDPADAGGNDDGTSGPESTLALSGSFVVDGVACHPTFDDLLKEVAAYDLGTASAITGLAQDTIETLAYEYASAKPAGIRMTQGIQRVNYSFLPFRAVGTLAAICGNIGKSGGGASHIYSQGIGNPLKPVDYTGSALNFERWMDTGGDSRGPAYLSAVQVGNLEHKTSEFYDKAIEGKVKFLWFATSNFVNMSPDLHKIVDEVLPAVDFIVTCDPFWTMTAKYSDIVLPATTNWESWDINDRVPWIQLNQPHIAPLGESKTDCEIMTMLAPKVGVEEYWPCTDEEWIREFVTSDHPGVKNLDFETFKEDGIYGREDGIFEPVFNWGDKKFLTDSGRFEFYTDSLAQFGLHVPTYRPPHEDPHGELGEKYPLVFLQYHDRITIHTQHMLADSLKAVGTEPQLQMNTKDAESRGIQHGDVVRVYNDRGECKVRAFLTEGIVPGSVAIPHGWTPDHFIEGNYQYLTHYKKNEAEEFYSQSNAALYDVLVEVEKA
ncbi:molybdopterin-dependent oxidoreductase [Raoultibacter phocaeensis]|uniref:molybdopterin-dependent oxidoreductase n=1 Tax=Raoultibacter phocaeensis TaxID=2479841 RepID=UPI0011182761|nr:molybdopterin-dependent oxidoreductase [Raoultibacter phocaeensis]